MLKMNKENFLPFQIYSFLWHSYNSIRGTEKHQATHSFCKPLEIQFKQV